MTRTVTIPVRYKIVSLLLTGTAINYLDRVNISVAAPAMMAATGLQKSEFGLVFSAFLLGYAAMQIPAGLIADKRNTKRVLAISFCALSLLTALTPLAAKTLMSLLIVRLLLGISEAMIFPAVTAFNVRWFPPGEFARAQMIGASGAPIGQMVAYPLTAWLVLQASWQMAFYVSAVLGLIWVAVWHWFSRNYPREHPAITAAELALVPGAENSDPSPGWPLRRLATAAPVVVLAASAMGFSFVLWTVLFWLPPYLTEARGLSLARVGAYGVAIQACGAIGLLGSGVLSDAILKRTNKVHIARTKLPAVCMLLAVVCLLAAVTTPSTPGCLILLGAFYFFLMSTPVAYHATPAALLPRQAASIYGIINCCASIGGIFGPAAVGFITTVAGRWERSFEMVAAIAFCSALLLFAAPVRPLEASSEIPPLPMKSGRPA